MRKIVALLLVLASNYNVAISATRKFSFPNPVSVADGICDMTRFERLDIIATEALEGGVTFPLRLVGRDQNDNIAYDKVFPGGAHQTNELSTAHSECTLVEDQLMIRDRLNLLSAKKLRRTDEYVVVIVKAPNFPDLQDCTVTNADCLTRMPWPKTDCGRQLYYFRDGCHGCRKTVEGEKDCLMGDLLLSCAVYQNEDSFSLCFVVSSMMGAGKKLAKGCVVGSMVDGMAGKFDVKYDYGEDMIAVDAELFDGGMPSGDHFRAPLERAGVRHRIVRLNVVHGATRISQDMKIVAEWNDGLIR